jgi:hypothetical protein
VVRDGKLRVVPVATGRAAGNLVAVSGLAPGEQVVLHPGAGLADGLAVTATRK